MKRNINDTLCVWCHIQTVFGLFLPSKMSGCGGGAEKVLLAVHPLRCRGDMKDGLSLGQAGPRGLLGIDGTRSRTLLPSLRRFSLSSPRREQRRAGENSQSARYWKVPVSVFHGYITFCQILRDMPISQLKSATLYSVKSQNDRRQSKLSHICKSVTFCKFGEILWFWNRGTIIALFSQWRALS